MRANFFKFFVSFFILGYSLECLATQQKTLMLDAEIDCGFEPSRVSFYLELDKQTSLRAAYLNKSEANKYIALLPVTMNELPQKFFALVIAEANTGQVCINEFTAGSNLELAKRFNYTAFLRTQISDLRSKKSATTNELLRTQHDLDRLKQDARVIGKLGRIAQKESELKKLEEQSVMLQQDLARLNIFLQQASKQANPRSFVKRQADLTSQLEELATAGRIVEDGEKIRTANSEHDWQQNLALIEETRFDDINELTSQLEQLRSARIRVEQRISGQVSESSSAEVEQNKNETLSDYGH